MVGLQRKNPTHLSYHSIVSLFLLLPLLSTPFAREATPKKTYSISPTVLIESMMNEYLTAVYKTTNPHFFEQSQRLLIATRDIWEKPTLTEMSKYPSLIEDEKTRKSMQIFVAPGKGKEMGHTLLNQTATLLGMESVLFKHCLFMDFIHVNRNKERIVQRQQELRTLLENKKLTYRLHEIGQEAQDPFTTTLCHYSTKAHPYYFQEALTMLQGKMSQRILGPTLAAWLQKIYPKILDKTQKEPWRAYLSRFFIIEIDLIVLANYLEHFINQGRKSINIWYREGPLSSLKTMINSNNNNISLKHPTPFGASIYYSIYSFVQWSWFGYIPYIGSPFYGVGLFFHSVQTLWNEFIIMNLFSAGENIYNHFAGMIERRQMLQQICNELLKILLDIYKSYKMVHQVYRLLEKNPVLKATFRKEYKAIRHFCVSSTNKKFRKELADILKNLGRRNPLEVYQIWNPFNFSPSDFIATYSKIEIIPEKQHQRFKTAILCATEVLYKVRIAKAIMTSGLLPISIPEIEETPIKHPTFQAKEAYTPLLINTENPIQIVKNDVHIGFKKSTHVVTGCNSGGKSTIIRTVSGNMFLAPLGFICGRDGRYSILGKIYYDSNPEDSVAKGESLFTYEARRAAEEYAYVQQSEHPVALFADEPVSKTAIVESEAFLGALSIQMADSPCPTVFLFSTHLTDLHNLIKKLQRDDFDFSKVEYIEGQGVTHRIIPGHVDEPVSNYILHEMNYVPEILNLQEDILMKDPRFKWKEKLKGYAEKKPFFITKAIMMWLSAILLILAIFYFLRRRYKITIHRRQ